MRYFLMALLLLTSSTAFCTEDSLRTSSPYDLFELFEDLYSTPEQAEEAIDYFDVLRFHRDLHFDELTGLPGISSSTAFRVTRSDTLDWRRISNMLTSRQSQLINSLIARPQSASFMLRSRMQVDPKARDERGYSDGRIQGDQYKLYDRLMLSQYGLRAGFLQAKDAGEARTFDHVRGYLQLQEQQPIMGNLKIDNAIVGDYSIGTGSGLLFASGGMQGKSSEVIDAVESNARGLQGYLSSSVGSGFRGAGATISLGQIRATAFYSSRSYDANIDSGVITSIDLDGYHRTSTEIAKIDSASATLLGSHLSYLYKGDSRIMQFGLTGFTESFSKPVLSSGFEHNLGGRSLAMLSQNGSYIDSNLSLDYEVAYSKQDSQNALGATLGFIYEASRKLQLSANGRYLPHNFVSRHGSAFGESTDDAQNERGAYLGVRYAALDDLTLSSYVDLSSTFAPPYLAEHNFRTTDLLLHVEYDLASAMKLTWRTRWKRKSDEERADDVKVLGSRDQINSRLEYEWTPSEGVRLRTRGEIVNVGYNVIENESSETGFLLSSSAKFKLFGMLGPEFRVTWFNTPSYDSRLYVYENDLQGASGLTLLYGAGVRYSMVMSVEPLEGIKLAAKYGITVYSKEREFGSSFTSRTGNTSAKLGFQLDVQF